jgi:hypothetical protein
MELTLAYIAGGIYLVGLVSLIVGCIMAGRHGQPLGPKGEWPLSKKLIITGPVLWMIAFALMAIDGVKHGKAHELLLGAVGGAVMLLLMGGGSFMAKRKKKE